MDLFSHIYKFLNTACQKLRPNVPNLKYSNILWYSQFLDYFSFLSTWLHFCHSETWVSYPCYADGTQLYLSFHPDDLTIAACISACLADIYCWMKDHHLQLNLAKTELLVVSANPSFHHIFTFQLGSSTITPSKTARNLCFD